MFGHTFYHNTIRRYVALFGTLFNDIYVNRTDSTYGQIKTVKVPVTYAPKEKVLARLTADPNLDRKPAIVLPRIAFQIESMKYAPERKLNTIGMRYSKDATDSSKLKYQYNPVPYDIDFSLSVLVKNADDGTQIVEQILPFFTPEWTTTIELIPDMDHNMDIPVVLNSVDVTDTYEGSFEERRAITWDMKFTLKGYLFGPVRKKKVIKFANIDVYSGMTSNTSVANIYVRPGLTANGDPTSDANTTVALSDIFIDDDFGYIITTTNDL